MLGPTERYASVAIGAVLLLLSKPSHPLRAVATAVAGGYLVYRGASGRCPLVGSITECCSVPGNSHLPHMHDGATSQPHDASWFDRQASYTPNKVDEAEMESFPASDPPSYSGGTASPSQHP